MQIERTSIVDNANLADQIAPHLPFLRRFARAVSGSQKSGDAYIVALLDALVEDQGKFDRDVSTRIALYRLFVKLWNSLLVNTDERADIDSSERNLAAITPRPRQAFLLSAVEEFSTEDVAKILEVDTDEVGSLIQQAADEIATLVETDILIIEDEPLIANDLERIVGTLGHNISGKARTHSEAIRAVEKQRPGLILADIQLADGSSGLDAVNEILVKLDLPVIFITAFPEKLLTGEKPEPAFLLTKPFDKNALKALISQALFFDIRASRNDEVA